MSKLKWLVKATDNLKKSIRIRYSYTTIGPPKKWDFISKIIIKSKSSYYRTIQRKTDKTIKSMVIGLRYRGPRKFPQTSVPLYIDAKEPDCASTGPYFEENECEIGRQTTFEINHCICQGDPAEPMLLQSSLFDAVFIGRTEFCTTNLGIWYFFGQETYIHFVAQETGIIRKLFIFFIFSSKRSKSAIKVL